MIYTDMTAKEKQVEMREQLAECMKLCEKDIKTVAAESGIDGSSLGRWLRGYGYMRYVNLCRVEKWINNNKGK